jgi:hypothetical protein
MAPARPLDRARPEGVVSELSGAAVRYAAAGLPVFPCQDKRPLVRHGLHDATTDRRMILRYWRRWPNAAIAVVTGWVSRLVVLDVDGREGADALRELELSCAPLPRTASVVTPRGGQHFYFRHPGGEIPNSAGQIGPGLDVRGDGGYVIAPPSSIGGRRYEADERGPVAALPPWLRAVIARFGTPPAHGRTAPEDWLEIVTDGVGEGQRNAQITRLTGHLLARDVDARLVRELVLLVAAHRCRPPLPSEEAERVVESIAGRELAKREAR